MVDHEILLRKLEKTGIANRFHSLLKTYLCNRRQYVVLQNKSSEPIIVRYGVPQGSILGPLLFVVYVNDLVDCGLMGKLLLYADDAAVFYAGGEMETLDMVKSDIDKITKWTNSNRIFLNEQKCQSILIGNHSSQNSTENIIMGKVPIKTADRVKYLGIFLDSKLTFTDHINKINSKIRFLITQFRRIGPFLTPQVRILLYNSYVKSHLTYLSPFWGLGSRTDIDRLQRTQNRVVKYLYNINFWTATDQVYKQTNLLKITEIVLHESLKLIYRIINGQICTDIVLTTNAELHSHQTRQRYNTHITTNANNLARRRLTHQAIIWYNALPQEVKQSVNISAFKRQTRQYIVDNRY